MSGVPAIAEVDVKAPREEVWKALTDPSLIEQYMFGSVVETYWQPGSPIVWKGEWNGKPFQDKGTVVDIRPPEFLKLTHYSPMSGQEDRPENYHALEYELTEQNDVTRLRLSQDGNKDQEEAEHSRENWTSMLESLKSIVEQPPK
jgi:uncharacterized protein YndB with AHSA1/START domain